MGASDNVVRGGLTPKHVDRDELLRLLAPPGTGPDLLPGTPTDGRRTAYSPGVPELALHSMELTSGWTALAPEPTGPALVLVLGGTARVGVGDATEAVGHGRAVLLAADDRAEARVSGTGTLWWATVGPGDPR